MKKIIIWVGIAIGVIIILLIITISSFNKGINKLVCKSNEGNITITYVENNILGYSTTEGITYDLDDQREYAKEVGIDNYMNEFSTWFRNNTTGTCEKNN